MANVKIVQLDEALTLDDADVLPVSDVSELETKKITTANLRAVIASGVGLQQAYDIGQAIDIEAAQGPITLDVAGGEGTALEIDTSDQTASGVRIIGASLPSTRSAPLLELSDSGANPAPLITLADLGGVKTELWSEKIRGVGNLIIEGANSGSVGALGSPVVVRGGDGAAGDGVDVGGSGGKLTLRSGLAGTDGGAGRGGAGHVEVGVEFAAPVTVDDGNLLLYAGPHPGALPTNGAIILWASEGLIYGQATTVSLEATEATDESVSLSANDPLGTIRLRSGGSNALQVFDTKLEPYNVDSYDLASSAIPFRRGYYGAGTIAAPSVRVGDDGTGLYSPGASQLGLGANNKAVIVDASGNRIALHADAVWSIGQLSTALANAFSGIFTVAAGGIQQARLHEAGLDFAHGKVGGFTIGQTSPTPAAQSASDLTCVAGTGGSTDGISLAAPGGAANFQSGHGGDGDATFPAGDGGNLNLLAGWGGFDGGGGPGAGGAVFIDAGRGSFGTGSNGTISIGKDYAASITSGPAAGSIPWTHNGDLTVTGTLKGRPEIVVEATTARSTADGDNGRSIYYTNVATITVTVDQAEVGTFSKHTQDNTGQVQLAAGTGVTLHYPATFLPNTAERNSPITLEWKTATDVYVSGDMEAV